MLLILPSSHNEYVKKYLKFSNFRFILANGKHPEVAECGRTVGSSLGSNEAVSSTSSVSNKRFHDYVETGDLIDHNHKRKAVREETDNVTTVKCRDAKKGTENYSSDLSIEIEAALKDKPKYLPTPKSSEKQKEDEAQRCSTGKTPFSNVPQISKTRDSHVQRAQTLKNKRDVITRPSQCLPAPGSSSRGHHGIVQMIGGILSVTHGRTARTKRLPAHHVNDRPSHLIHGDKPPQNYSYPFTNSSSCSCGETEALYKLECEHLLCRNCLLGKHNHKEEVTCDTCQRTSKKSCVSKHHNKSIFSDA